mmetsp:Transcript_67655/g.207251  ORF Transcript_67655/g.207251 Transcript_67655/m.207251 type:complete len:129 (-) Transcript_67655:34-420(-)
MWTAEAITGTWTRTSVYKIPAPFNASPYLNYAAKAHPELVQPAVTAEAVDVKLGLGCACACGCACDSMAVRERGVELMLSFVTNVLTADTDEQHGQSTGNLLFGKGQMAWPVRAYWPRFLRVVVRKSQ